MFQLILDHTYRFGQAVDVSGKDNHGTVWGVGYEPNGEAASSGALVFKQTSARVHVRKRAPGTFWDALFALRIDVWARVEAFGSRRNLVEGDNSFAFYIDPQGFLHGDFHAPQVAGGPLVWHGPNSQTWTPNGQPHKVPLNRWTKLSYIHDGYANLRLEIDDEVVAVDHSLVAGVPPVGAAGVTIGNWTLTDRYTFDGRIDGVKIYRYDPDEAYLQFFCRNLNKTTAPCWQAVFRVIEERLKDPTTGARLAALMGCIALLQAELIRAVRSQGESVTRQAEEFSARYRKLWCKGKLDGAAMLEWQKAWMEWLTEILGADRWAAFLRRFEACLVQSEFSAILPRDLDLRRCDPQFVSYLTNFTKLLPSHQKGT